MKTSFYYLIALLALVIATACTDYTDEPEQSADVVVDDDGTRLYAIKFLPPKMYAAATAVSTRADGSDAGSSTNSGGSNTNGNDSNTNSDGSNTNGNDTTTEGGSSEEDDNETVITIVNEDAELSNLLKDKEKLTFDNGTTLWILIEEPVKDENGDLVKDENGNTQWQPKDASLNIAYTVLKVVNADGTTTSDMVPCSVDDNGNVTSFESKLLYLPKGYYRIRALSPALKLAENNKVTVTNGTTLLANYDYCSLTMFTTLSESDFTKTTDAIKTVQLNALVHQTAYLDFQISPAPGEERIYSIVPMEKACTIFGLQTEIGELNWTANEPTWTLYLNNKNDELTIPDDNFTQTDDTHIRCGTSILPTNAMSTTIYVTLNLRVNGVPTQYMTSINDHEFHLGFRYPFKIYISLDGAISMASWLNFTTTQTVTIP